MIPQKKIKRVMLMYPNQLWYKYDLTTTWNLTPFVLCILGTMLQDKYQVKIVDAQFYNLSEDDFRREVEAFQPDVVGISLLTSEYASILDTAAAIIKGVNKDIVTIAGGVHVATQYLRVMENKDVDLAVRGEGEYVLRQLLDHINGDGAMPQKGVVYRQEDGKINALPPDFIVDLDALPLPNYDLVNYRDYLNRDPRNTIDSAPEFPYARLLTSRGCPVGCSFCQVHLIAGSQWRKRSAKRVVDELVLLKKQYGIKSFYFDDDNPFCQKARTKEMLHLIIDQKLDLKWKCADLAVFATDEEILKLMAESGCVLLGIAIESGSPRVLKEIVKKPVKLDKVPILIKAAQKHGIYVAANFIIGFPGETWDEIRQTVQYAETCGADYVKFFPANPLLGTEMFKIAKEMNAIEGDELALGWRYGRIKSTEFTPKDISILRAYEWDRVNFSDPKKQQKTASVMNITIEELNKQRKATRDALKFDTV
jgi:anaerobic magnesium-protoporphyrin IX monomethyl ester cyclase